MTEPTSNPSAEAASNPTPENALSIDQAVEQGGAYEVLRRRLNTLGTQVQTVADTLNAQRLSEFGDSKMALLGRFRLRTENNCVGRDIVQVGDRLLFGFNVFIGLKSQTRIEDVFGLYRLYEKDDGYDVETIAPSGTFLADPAFVRDFDELYAYYKDARLLQLLVGNDKLLAAFQIGERSSDMRVFRWVTSPAGPTYLDARGNADIAPPAPFDFKWIRAGRENEVSGRFPHLNILDTLFVETSRGDLTIKLENNTETGEGIYSEPVEDTTQSLDDATFEYAQVGSLILLRVLPYREKQWRGLIYNILTRKVLRNDAILQVCVQLPEDHGIIFPGGYYLQNGEHQAFGASMEGMQFERVIRSPNGEDVLYVFYEPVEGLSALFVYNMIQRQLQQPVFAHGYALMPDGRMVLFHAENTEPTRVHQMQVWQTPFFSDEYAATRPTSNSFLGRLGNAEVVRGVSNLYNLSREIAQDEVSVQRYEHLVGQTRQLFELHRWFDDQNTQGLRTLLQDIEHTSEAVLDEFEKVQSIRAQSEQALQEARAEQRKLLAGLQPENWNRIQEFVDALGAITAQHGRLLTIREARYIDTAAIDAMSEELQQANAQIGSATGAFLAGEQALQPFAERLQALEEGAEAATTAKAIAEQVQAMQQVAGELDLLSELMTSLRVDDATGRTRVVEAISGLYARLNQLRARAEQKRKALGSGEAIAQFAAQFSLFGQSVTSALSLATSPERADEQLSRLLLQLEELEGQFGEHEQFLTDIIAKREEVLEVFETHKQALLDERQRKAQAVQDAANRILDGLDKRTERLSTPEELNAFFAGDPMILKLRELTERVRELKDTVKADDIEARLKASRDRAFRVLRDRQDLFENGGNVIRLGPRHRFSVNTQPLDLTLLPRGDELAAHLTGTDYLETLHNPVLSELRAFWPITLDSESPEVYRGEYLAGEVLQAAEEGRDGLNWPMLIQLVQNPSELDQRVREFAAPRYREGYEKGIHDHDAALILQGLVPLIAQAGALIYPPMARALALMAWAGLPQQQADWQSRLKNAYAMQQLFGTSEALTDAVAHLGVALAEYWASVGITHTAEQTEQAAEYLAAELQASELSFGLTRYAAELLAELETRLAAAGLQEEFEQSLARLDLAGRWALVLHWLRALTLTPDWAEHARYVPEAAALKLFGPALPHAVREVQLLTPISGLLGEHPRIQGGSLTLSADETLARLQEHRQNFVPAFRRYQAARQQVIAQERESLRLEEYQARPLTSFVRNRLINDIYLPIIGDNLAKQIGTVGEDKRSDLMGLLMLISPPGYGKTTLLEYVASRLGLVFMKINGPALGHGVRSLDSAQAPDATSRQELEKLNLALEMGNNVMLYIDDIQHTHPEFLQKFISLTDGTRRIEGVWKGKTKTYDLRGHKFAVVMAGNPYTESGEVFKIPDMLANRADIYNLGDVLGGVQDAFLLSYLENSLTSNPVLAPLATRDLNDLYLLVDKAQGKDISTNALSYAYSAAELNEIVTTLQKLIVVRDVLYKVNQAYIASAAQADLYRTEPTFKLQGSYRNMNKLAEKVSPVMNDSELQQLIADHYLGEAQLLTTGAEENLLKLAELRGVLTAEQAERWEQIKAEYRRHKTLGGDETEVGGRMVMQLADIASGLQALGQWQPQPQPPTLPSAEQTALADALKTSLATIAELSAGGQTPAPAENSALQTQLAVVPEALKATIAPLLASIAASGLRQDQLTEALHLLVSTIQQRQTTTRSAANHVVGRHEQAAELTLE